MPAVAMTPKAGAHGELCGMMAIKAALAARGEKRSIVLVPESAHGTNPATAALLGYRVERCRRAPDGTVDPEEVKKHLSKDVAAIMLTNPNTCGLFERDVVAIAEAVHAAGAYFYADGANFNAIVGKVRPGDLGVDAMHINLHKTFSTPHGGGGPGAGPVVLSEALAPFAPVPYVVADGGWRPLGRARGRAAERKPFGRMCAFHGQMGMFVRAMTYMLAHGSDGMRQASEDAVLNANYVRAGLKDLMSLPFGDRPACTRRCSTTLARRHRRLHARFRQGDDRRGLPPDDGVFPAGRARRDADRADRVGEQGLARPVHRGAARSRVCGEARRHGALLRRAVLCAAPPSRRDARRARAGAAVGDARAAERGGGVALCPGRSAACDDALQTRDPVLNSEGK